MLGQSSPKDSKIYHSIVSAYLFLDENGNIDIEEIDSVTDDDESSEIFCDKERMLLDFIDIGDKEVHYFMAHIKAWFHTYYDYLDGYQCEIEYEVNELKSIDDFKKISFNEKI